MTPQHSPTPTTDGSPVLVPSYDAVRAQENSLTRLITQGGIADKRAALALTTNLAMLGVMASLLSAMRHQPVHDIGFWLGGIALLLNAISMVFVGYATFPRFSSNPNHSTVFYGSIAHSTLADFDQRIKTQSESSYLDDLNAQCHFMGQVCEIKFMAVKRAMIILFVAIIPWLAAVAVVYKPT